MVINNAPNLADLQERRKIKSMSHAFATTRHTIGDDSLQFWLLEMERYYLRNLKTDINKNTQNFYSLALHFFNSKNTEPWSSDVKWTRLPNGKLKIKAFRFLIKLNYVILIEFYMNCKCKTFKSFALSFYFFYL